MSAINRTARFLIVTGDRISLNTRARYSRKYERAHMKINADVYVKDVPGSLVASLDPISTFSGNIIGVVHHREQIISGRILVHIIFDMPAEQLKNLTKEWKKRDVIIVKMDEATEIYSMNYMLVGNVSGSYIDQLEDDLTKMTSYISFDVGYASGKNNENGSTMFNVTVHSKEDLEKVDKYFKKESEVKKFTLIRGVSI